VKCLMREPRVLVLDEPTAVLLPAEIDGLLGLCRRLAQRGCAVLLVTHKLAEIKKVADRVSVLRGGQVVARTTDAVRDIAGLVRAMIHRDPDALDDTVGAAVAVGAMAPPAPSKRRFPGPATEVLQADGLTLRDADGVTRLDTFSLVVNRGEIVGVAGVEGNGQGELAALLSGMRTASAGRFFVAGRELTHATPEQITGAGVGVVPEDRHAVGCITAMSLAENLFLNRLGEFTRHGFLRGGALRAGAQALMKEFDVRAAGPDVSFASLSGGNQQKAVLARELTLENLVFLLAAQPTRGLDVGAVEAVYRQIRAACDRGVGVLLISSELDELLAVCDRILVLYRGRIMGVCRSHPSERERIGAMMAGQAA
ncbi:MAG: ATP-binding cassette domain-containing protein, partial [Gammaproteobacteria bacterium]